MTGAPGEPGQKGGRGGRGGQGGRGGYGGTIVVENFSGRSFVGQLNISLASSRGATGPAGNDGAGGQHGKHGQSAGDVGMIDNVIHTEWGQEDFLFPIYYGFDYDCVIDVNYSIEKPRVRHALCEPRGQDLHYATLSIDEAAGHLVQMSQHEIGSREEKTTHGQNDEEEAVKKKTITSQSLDQYFDQVTDRKHHATVPVLLDQQYRYDIHQLLDDLLLSLEFSQFLNIDDVEDVLSTSFVRNVNNERLMAQQQTRERPDHVPAGNIYEMCEDDNPICKGCSKSGVIALLHDQPRETKAIKCKLDQKELVKCFNRLETADGTDSIFHAIFGQKDSYGSYSCQEAEQKRKALSNYVRKHGGKQYAKYFSPFVKTFVLEVDKDDKDTFPVAFAQQDKYFAQYKRGDGKGFDWVEAAESATLMEEYAKYIESPGTTLGLSEIKMLALYHNMKIHVYLDTDDEFPPVLFDCTISNSKDDEEEHWILYQGDGAWQRLDVNEKLHQFYQQRARQAANWKLQMPSKTSGSTSGRCNSCCPLIIVI